MKNGVTFRVLFVANANTGDTNGVTMGLHFGTPHIYRTIHHKYPYVAEFCKIAIDEVHEKPQNTPYNKP